MSYDDQSSYNSPNNQQQNPEETERIMEQFIELQGLGGKEGIFEQLQVFHISLCFQIFLYFSANSSYH